MVRSSSSSLVSRLVPPTAGDTASASSNGLVHPVRARGKPLPIDRSTGHALNESLPSAAPPAKQVAAATAQSDKSTASRDVHAEPAKAGSADYEVGYRKPPAKHQFKKGQSGNPKGRAKGARNIWTILQEEARIVVAFSENGKPSKASKTELAIRSAMNKAVKGDLRALQIILKLFETHAPSPETVGRSAAVQTPAISRHEMDREILDMLGLSEHLSPSEASSDDPPADDTDKPQN